MLVLVIVAVVSVATIVGSACLGTKTVMCEKTGLHCEPGQICDIAQDACIDIGGCGDGIISKEKEADGTPKEVCDDGNTSDGDGCSANCKSNETCGNGVMDMVKDESCDHGASNGTPDDSCSVNCVLAACGNGAKDTNEECDPGQQDSPGCNSSMGRTAACKFSRCGDGYTNIPAGEECDDGMTASATCNSPAICKLSKCGDNFYNPTAGEECDTGGDTQACNGNNGSDLSQLNESKSKCHIPNCGDGYLNNQYRPPNAESGQKGEQCDNGNSNSDELPDACRTNCHNAFCGDGVTDTIVTLDHPKEECDDGDAGHDLNRDGKINSDTIPDACRTNCRRAFCGDGVIDNNEKCDDLGIDTLRCNSDCTLSRCGDGHLNKMAHEECDNGEANSNTTPDACRMNCKAPSCGDGVVDTGEQCEPVHPNDVCGGQVVCNKDCHLCP